MFDVFELIKPMTRGNAGERDGSTEVAQELSYYSFHFIPALIVPCHHQW